MVELVPVPVVPVADIVIDDQSAVIMVDSQPHTGRARAKTRFHAS